MRATSVVAALFVVGACSSSSTPNKAPPGPDQSASAGSPQGDTTAAAPDDAGQPPPSGSTVLPLGGERIRASADDDRGPLDAHRPSLEGLPRFAAEPVAADAAGKAEALHADGVARRGRGERAEASAAFVAALEANPGHLLARYDLATSYAAGGEHTKALGLLAQLLSAKACPPCANFVKGVTSDVSWQALWATPSLCAVLAAWEPEGDEPADEWWEKEADACPKGSTLVRKLDDSDEGEVYCRKGNGQKHGPYRRFETGIDMGEGSLTISGRYADGKRQGVWVHTESFAPSTREYFVDDKRVGVVASSHQDEESYELAFADRIVSWTADGDGNLLSWTETRRGKPHGMQKRWVVDGGFRTLIENKTFRDGVPDGEAIDYHATTGHPARLVTYGRGTLDGPVKYWDETGKLLGETVMTRGSGEWLAYDAGVLVERGTLRDGAKDGEWLEDRGRSKGRYAMGQRVGPWVLSTASHDKAEGAFENGKRVGGWTFRRDGKLAAEGAYVAGKPDGEWSVSNADGVATTLVFRRGKLVTIDDERFAPKRWEFDAAAFAEDPAPPTPREADENDDYIDID